MAPLLRAQQDFLAVNFAGNVFRINALTGAGTLLGPSGLAGLNSMARDTAGTLFTVSGSSLLSINPVTGVATPQVSLSLPGISSVDVRGLAFSPAGTLYLIQNGGSTATPDLIYSVDVSTGGGTLVGTSSFSGIQGLTFSGMGLLYGWETGSGSGVGAGLVLINALNGATTDVNPAVGGLASQIQGLAFGTDGRLYGAGNALYTVDLLTGASTLVGAGSYADIRGLEVVPEPSTIVLVLCGLGMGSVAAWRRRHMR